MGAVGKRLERIIELGGLRAREVAQLLDTRPETVSRWKTGQADPQREKLARILELEWCIEKLSTIYPDHEDARLWLLSRNNLLQGDTPADRIQKGRIGDVLQLIAQIEDGAYV